MIDIKFIREEKEKVKENIKKKFQEEKLPLVDTIYEKDIEYRKIKTRADELRSTINRLSKQIGELIRKEKKDEVDQIKEEVSSMKEKIIHI